jgi:Tol biopolymer transport system component
MTADARMLVTVRSESRGTLWVAPATGLDNPTRVASVPDTVGSIPPRWTSDGRIIFNANTGGNFDIWAVRPDGSGLRQLTTSGFDGYATVAPDDRYIAFVSYRDSQSRVWRMDPDGGGQKVLTSGSSDHYPIVAADSRNVYFQRRAHEEYPMYQVPMEGGQPTLVSATPEAPDGAKRSGVPAGFHPHDLSPDGSLIIGWYYDPGAHGVFVNVDIPLPPLALRRSYAWAPDGRAITFVRTSEGVANLWRQPLDGGPATRLTSYTSGGAIPNHAWSRDGSTSH